MARLRVFLPASLAVSFLVVPACGGKTSRAPYCPPALPPAGSPCTLPTSLDDVWPCEYGSNPHCTTFAVCAASSPSGPYTWYEAPLTPNATCAPNAPSCPASFGAVASGGACPSSGECTYPEGRCACIGCFVSLPNGQEGTEQDTEWECEAWVAPPGCPEPRPLMGTACTTEGQECDYGPMCCDELGADPAMVCRGGYWDFPPIDCDCIDPECGS